MRPRKIALFFGLCIALLGVLCVVFPKRPIQIGPLQLRWTTLASVLDLEKPTQKTSQQEAEEKDFAAEEEFAAAENSLATGDFTSAEELGEVEPFAADTTADTRNGESYTDEEPATDTTTDTRIYLSKFYAALETTHSQAVRVVHYGDSQIEEDRMTLSVRRALQERYGGGGVGLIPLQQTIPTRTLHQTLTVGGRTATGQQGVVRNLVYGPKTMRRKDGLYGAMGQVAILNDSLQKGSEQVTLRVEPAGRERHTESYFNRIRVWADGTIRMVTPAGDTLTTTETIRLKDSTTTYTLSLCGRGQVYGISLENEKGITMDNIPMRGCLGTVFRSMDRGQLTEFYRQTHTRLIILQFGGNAIPFNEQPSTIKGIVNQLAQQVRYVRSCAPEASILFVGPGDMITLQDGEQATYPLLPYMDRLLHEMALQEHIAYYSLYKAMGGRNSMVEWQRHGWAGSDGVHFTRKGAEIAGQKLAEWLLERPAAPTSTASDTLQHAENATAPTSGTALPTHSDTIATE